MPLQRSLQEILNSHADAIRADMRKVLPGTVTAVHAARQTVDVQLAVNAVLFDDLGTAVSVPAPSVTDVPLGVMRGGGFLVWVPVAVGDSVLLIFSDLSVDTWRASQDGNPVDPGGVGQHTHDSPFAMPCVSPDRGFLTSTPTDNMVIGKDGTDEQIVISSSDIKLGAGASQAVALCTLIDLLITTLVANPYTPTLVGLGTFFSALTAWKTANGWGTTTTTTGATLVKAE